MPYWQIAGDLNNRRMSKKLKTAYNFAKLLLAVSIVVCYFTKMIHGPLAIAALILALLVLISLVAKFIITKFLID
jgi:hypothetical protein